MQRLELYDASKFWCGRIDGDTLLVRSGKLGTDGRERAVKPSSAEGKRGNLVAELRSRAWKELRRGYRYSAKNEDEPLRWLLAAPDYMGIHGRSLSVSPSGKYAVIEQHSGGRGSRVYTIGLEAGSVDKAWDGTSFLLRGVWALDDHAVLFTPEHGTGWQTRVLSLTDGTSSEIAVGDFSMMGTILGADRSGTRVLVASGTLQFAVLDRASGRELLRGPVPPTRHNQGRQFALSPDGSKLVVAAPPSGDAPEDAVSTLTVYDVATGECEQRPTEQSMPFDALAWVGDDRFVALERFQPPQLWHVRPRLAPGPSLGEAIQSSIRPTSLAGSPNGRYVALYDGSGGLVVVEAETLTEAFSARHPLFGTRGAVAVGPGGVVVTTGGAMIGRWDTGLET